MIIESLFFCPSHINPLWLTSKRARVKVSEKSTPSYKASMSTRLAFSTCGRATVGDGLGDGKNLLGWRNTWMNTILSYIYIMINLSTMTGSDLDVLLENALSVKVIQASPKSTAQITNFAVT